MKIQSITQDKTLTLFSLSLGMLGIIPSTWSFFLLSNLGGKWAGLIDWYWSGGGFFTLIIPSSIISLVGLIIGIIVSKRQKDRHRIATAGVILGAVGTLQILLPLFILLVVGTW